MGIVGHPRNGVIQLLSMNLMLVENAFCDYQVSNLIHWICEYEQESLFIVLTYKMPWVTTSRLENIGLRIKIDFFGTDLRMNFFAP